jgi:hypothetical protein
MRTTFATSATLVIGIILVGTLSQAATQPISLTLTLDGPFVLCETAGGLEIRTPDLYTSATPPILLHEYPGLTATDNDVRLGVPGEYSLTLNYTPPTDKTEATTGNIDTMDSGTPCSGKTPYISIKLPRPDAIEGSTPVMATFDRNCTGSDTSQGQETSTKMVLVYENMADLTNTAICHVEGSNCKSKRLALRAVHGRASLLLESRPIWPPGVQPNIHAFRVHSAVMDMVNKTEHCLHLREYQDDDDFGKPDHMAAMRGGNHTDCHAPQLLIYKDSNSNICVKNCPAATGN